MRARLPLVLIAALTLFTVLRAAAVQPLLPDLVASHFGASGQADGWQEKDAFFVLGAVLLAVLLALSAGLPLLIRVLPAGAVNLPNPHYWLAPERKAATLEGLARALAWFGVATLGFFSGVFELVYAANLAPEPRGLSRSIWLLLAGYLGFTAVWLTLFVRRYRRVPRDDAQKS